MPVPVWRGAGGQAELDEARQRIEDLLKEKEKAVAKAEAKVKAEKDKEIAKLKAEIAALQGGAENSEALATMQMEYDSLLRKLQQLEADHSHCDEEIRRLKHELKVARGQHDDSSDPTDELHDKAWRDSEASEGRACTSIPLAPPTLTSECARHSGAREGR